MDEEEAVRREGWASDTSRFASRTAWIFVTSVTQLALNALTLFVVARLLGPGSYGEYALALAWTGVVFAVGQFGLPAAMTFFAGRGRAIASLERIGVRLAVGVSAALVVVGLVAIPLLHDSLLRAAPPPLLALALVVVPCPFLTQFAAGILYARGRNLAYNRIVVAQGALLLGLTALFVGVADGGVVGAFGAYAIASWAAAVVSTWEVHRLASGTTGVAGPSIGVGEFVRYAVKLYPQNVTSFFSYRADVFLLSGLLPNPEQPVGLYSLAVRAAEITFYVPNSISAMLYPAVSASDRAQADRVAPLVGRMTVLVTLLAGTAITIGAVGAISVLLPAYTDALPALLVLMPGILSLSLSKILASYLTGLGKPVPTAIAASVSLVVNVSLNLVLIPTLGIVGAAVASAVSYTLQTVMLLGVASRLAGVGAAAFVVPGRDDVGRLRTLALRTMRRGQS